MQCQHRVENSDGRKDGMGVVNYVWESVGGEVAADLRLKFKLAVWAVKACCRTLREPQR